MAQVTAMDIWEASQTGIVQTLAYRLWGSQDGAQEGVAEAIARAIARIEWFNPRKGKLTSWLMMIMTSLKNAEQYKGYRRGTIAPPLISYPGEEELPELADLCDPESILIAREIYAERTRG